MSMQETFQLATMLTQTQGILPPTIRTPGECVAVILAGRELGLPPMAALRTITLLKGKVTIDSAGQLGLMQAAGAKVEWLKSDDKEAHLRLTRPGNTPFETTYTIEMASKAGLLGNQTWQKYPRAMLRARCVSAAGKAYMADVLAGIYLPGEMDGDSRPEDNVIDAHAVHAQGVELLHAPPARALPASSASPAPAAKQAPQAPPQPPTDPVGSLVDRLYACRDQATYSALYAEMGRRRWKTYSETEQQALIKAAAHAREQVASIHTEAAEQEREAAEAEAALRAQEAALSADDAPDNDQDAATQQGAAS